jgi:hypothetical protein
VVGREVKKVYFSQILLNKEPTLVAGQSNTAFGGNRNPEESRGIRTNPEESGGIRRNPEESGVNTGIPVLQEFLWKITVTAAKKRSSCDHLQNHAPVKKSSGKHRKKRNDQESCFFCFWAPKIDSCQTGIGNLVGKSSDGDNGDGDNSDGFVNSIGGNDSNYVGNPAVSNDVVGEKKKKGKTG